MSDKLKKLMHKKIDEMNDVFSSLDQFFQQFDFYHSTIRDLILNIFQEDQYIQQMNDIQFEQNLLDTQNFANSDFKNMNTIKVQSKNLSNQMYYNQYDDQEQQVNHMINSGKQLSGNLRNILEQYIIEIEQKDKTTYYNEKNKKMKQKMQGLQNKIEALQKENFDLKIENTKIAKVDEQVLQTQKSFITTYNEQGVDSESYQKVKDKNFALEKQNYFLQLKISTLENQLNQISQKSEILQKSMQDLQQEYLSLYKTTQKAISNNEIDTQSQFMYNDDDTIHNQTGFAEISDIQNDRKKSDIDPVLIDRLLNQNNELLQYFNSEDRKEVKQDFLENTKPLQLQSIKENHFAEGQTEDQTNIDTKKKFEELFSEKEFLNQHATKKQSSENFNKSQQSFDSKGISEEDDQDLYNTQQTDKHDRRESDDKNILRGFGDLGSFRTPVVQNDVQGNVKKIKQSLSNQPYKEIQKIQQNRNSDNNRVEESEARFSIVEMRNSKEDKDDDGFFNQENIFLNQFFVQCQQQEDKYEDDQEDEDSEIKDIQIQEPERKRSKFRTKVEIF